MLDLTYQDFGENILAPIVNNDGSQLRADATRFVNFAWFGPTVALSFSAVVDADVTPLTAGKLVLIAAQAHDALTGTVLAEVDFPKAGTNGFKGYGIEVSFLNPGGTAYLVLASQSGTF